ncbi:MAG TPA: peptidyl-tRNA hydrolase [Thermoleophilaceae bacterium]|nr:peptidyl-tRNA hydrolase [Thermoleophilaceae bacterium]
MIAPGSETAAADDPLVMYYVVRTGVRFTLEQAMEAAGAAAVDCVERFGHNQRFNDAFGAWHDRPRKVALRAGEEDFARVKEDEPCAVHRDNLLCLPPRKRSDRSTLLESLNPFTDAPRPKEPPPPLPGDTTRMVYAIRPGVMRTAGKAMAQAGHAALMCVERFGGGDYEERFEAWRESGRRGELVAVSDEDWERLKRDPEAVVVSDAGHTQVAPGTETVIALVPTTRESRPA